MVGFLVSSWTLSLYVGLDSIPRDQWPAVPRNDPRWVGAWWLGLLVLGAAMVILALPLFFFPKKLGVPGKSWRKSEDAGLSCNGVELRGVKRAALTEKGLPEEANSDPLEREASDETQINNFESKESTKAITDHIKGILNLQSADALSLVITNRRCHIFSFLIRFPVCSIETWPKSDVSGTDTGLGNRARDSQWAVDFWCKVYRDAIWRECRPGGFSHR